MQPSSHAPPCLQGTGSSQAPPIWSLCTGGSLNLEALLDALDQVSVQRPCQNSTSSSPFISPTVVCMCVHMYVCVCTCVYEVFMHLCEHTCGSQRLLYIIPSLYHSFNVIPFFFFETGIFVGLELDTARMDGQQGPEIVPSLTPRC